MEEESRTVKKLLMKIFDKCKEARPQIAALTQIFDNITHLQCTVKLKKKDCMKPQFLVQLSDCGQRIRRILQEALQYESDFRECLLESYNDYMDVIRDIRRYHQQAHLGQDTHKNKTTMIENLLRELNREEQRRKQLQKEIERMRKMDRGAQDGDRVRNIQEEDTHSSISQISQTSKREINRHSYSGRNNMIIQQDNQQGHQQLKFLKSKVVYLQQQLVSSHRKHQEELQEKIKLIAQIQKNYAEELKLLRKPLPQKQQPSEELSQQIRKIITEKDRNLEMQRKLLIQKHGMQLEEQKKLLTQKERLSCLVLEQQLASKDRNHSLQLQQQRKQIREIELKFQEFTRANSFSQSRSKLFALYPLNIASIHPSIRQLDLDQTQYQRWMLAQASTIQSFLKEAEQ